MELTGVNDLNRLDRELDHLHALGLLTAGMVIDAPFTVMDEKAIADLRPTPWVLRCMFDVEVGGIPPLPILIGQMAFLLSFRSRK